MKQDFRVIDSELHLMEPFDLWERGLAEPLCSWTKVVPPPEGHLAPSATRFAIGRDATLPPDHTSVVLKQALRRWPDDHHMVKASTQCSPEVFLEGLDIEGIDVAILTPTLGIAVTTRDDLEPQHALALAESITTTPRRSAAPTRRASSSGAGCRARSQRWRPRKHGAA